MGIHLEPRDFDRAFEEETHKETTVIDYDELTEHELFKRSAVGKRRVVINSVSDTSSEEKDYINSNLFSTYDYKSRNTNLYSQYTRDNSIDTVPTCQCQFLRGARHLGKTCPECGTPVSRSYDDGLESLIWIKAPKGIPALINPIIWTMLCKRFMAEGRFDTLRWICDTNYVAPNRRPRIADDYENQQLGRGLINFYNHFDEIMEFLFDYRGIRDAKTKSDGVDVTRKFVKMYRHLIFCQYIPMPSKLLMVVEKTPYATYLDQNITSALDALWSLAGIDNEFSNLKIKQKENRTIKAISLLSEYHSNIIKQVYMKKEGILRDHVFATRTNYSFRCVISSQTKAHQYNCISIPWAVAVTTLRYFIIPKLWRKGYEPKQVQQILDRAEVEYSPLMDEIFQEIIDEYTGYPGIPVTATRYPSLKRGSTQLLYINEIKKDLSDVTVSVPILVCKPWNAIVYSNSTLKFNLR